MSLTVSIVSPSICHEVMGPDAMILLFGMLSFKPDFFTLLFHLHQGFPGGSDGEASVYNAGDLGLIPGLGRSPGEGNGNPLQYSCLENPMNRGT